LTRPGASHIRSVQQDIARCRGLAHQSLLFARTCLRIQSVPPTFKAIAPSILSYSVTTCPRSQPHLENDSSPFESTPPQRPRILHSRSRTCFPITQRTWHHPRNRRRLCCRLKRNKACRRTRKWPCSKSTTSNTSSFPLLSTGRPSL